MCVTVRVLLKTNLLLLYMINQMKVFFSKSHEYHQD